jgi:EmrB/QacA subfamily drug resistance transporter
LTIVIITDTVIIMSTEIITRVVPDRGAARRRTIALVAVLLAQFMLILDATVVNVALPAIQAGFGLHNAELTWITNAYLIAFGGLLLLFGRLGDLFGRRPIFLAGLALFTLASIACGVAPSAEVLVAARFVQGVGAAAASSVILAIIVTEFPDDDQRARAMSGYMFVSVAGGSMGLFVGGALTQLLSWHWIFLINVPIGALGLWLAATTLRDAAPRAAERKVDVAGAVLVTAAAMSAIYGLVAAAHQPWTAPAVRVPLCLAIGLVVVFFWVEASVRNPVLPPRMMRIRSLVVTSAVRGLLAMGLYGTFFLASLDMSETLGFGPLRVGLAFLPQTLVVAALSLGVTARLIRRLGPTRVLIIGLAVTTVGVAAMASLAIDEPYFPVRMLGHVVLGLGFGLSFLPLLTLAMSEVPGRDAGIGSAIVNLSQQLSAAVDIAILVTIASSHTHALIADGAPPRDAVVLGYRLAYAVAVAGVLLALTLAATLLRPSAAAREAAPARWPRE